ncbi:unnamed protein product [Rotaria socialis]|uniref:Uncharacterized protein n=1 Tax=Rotaria socialis TaxID=392032 RepID=A0A820VW63_9BILA|nr:unnamed protein product [Rotaria socialis]
MPTSAEGGQRGVYLARSKFATQSVVNVDVDSLPNVLSKNIRRAGGGASTSCKVVATIAVLFVVGAAAAAVFVAVSLAPPAQAQQVRQLLQQRQRQQRLQQQQRRQQQLQLLPLQQQLQRVQQQQQQLLQQQQQQLPQQQRLQLPLQQQLLLPQQQRLQRPLQPLLLPQPRPQRQLPQLPQLRQQQQRLRQQQEQQQRQRRLLPQQLPSLIVVNLATLGAVTASNFYSGAGSPSAQGDYVTGRAQGGGFNAGGFAPQYIEIDLPGIYSISSVCLSVGQLPNGATVHEIYMGATSSSLSLVTTLSGYTYSGQWLNTTYSPMVSGISSIHVSTVSSPSWVAWNLFLVYGV